jgi:two-component system cell cycle sensor histidine kinase/response regulator CckA
MFGRLAGSAVELHTELPGEGVYIHADPGQLESLLMNLTVNARDAMPEGGKLSVGVTAVDLQAGDKRLGEAATPGRYAVLRVEDTGTGIAPEHLQRIFEPYFTTKAMGRGTGLGLASVYGVVREHDGFVHVDSEVGRGTVFEVYLPMGQERATRASLPPRPARAPARKGVVLVVDDMEPLRAMVADVLRDAGLVVLAAGDGLEALEALGGKDPIDLVVTDLLMPRMSGVELAQALRERAPRLGIVFMSGYADRDLLSQVEAVAPSAPVLHKPFTAIELEQVVSQELRRRQDARTSAP